MRALPKHEAMGQMSPPMTGLSNTLPKPPTFGFRGQNRASCGTKETCSSILPEDAHEKGKKKTPKPKSRFSSPIRRTLDLTASPSSSTNLPTSFSRSGPGSPTRGAQSLSQEREGHPRPERGEHRSENHWDERNGYNPPPQPGGCYP